MGQHAAFIQGAFSQKKDFETLEQAQAHIDQMQRIIYAMTQGYYLPGSVMHGLYENTVYFRVGDHTRFKVDKNSNSYANRVAVPGKPVKKVVIRCGGLDYEDPGTERSRYPADYAIRLIEVVVKK
jgi:hypothetical protein